MALHKLTVLFGWQADLPHEMSKKSQDYQGL